MIKLVENNHYHVWTDALHARALADESNNRWDRGTYVRWTIMTAWIAIEIACQEALEEPNISRRFKDNLDQAINDKSFPKLNWKQGTWQQVLCLQKLRKNCVHRFFQESDLFPEADISDKAINIAREAIISIYKHVGKDAPSWVNDDTDQGWANKGGFKIFANAYGTQKGVDENANDTIKITYIYKDKEHTREILAPGTDPTPYVKEFIQTISLPISGIKVYEGKKIIQEVRFPMDKIRGT